MRGSIVFALVSFGCYAPSPPSGSYTCNSDLQCPTNLSCQCGVCVNGPDDAACSFAVAIDATSCDHVEQDNCVVREDVPFNLLLTAYKHDGTQSSYSGTAKVASTWGHAHLAAPFNFQNGTATASVALDRATPDHATAVVTVSIGAAAGASEQSFIVDPPPLAAEVNPVLDANSGWAKVAIGLPSIDVDPSGTQHLYFTGFAGGSDKQARIGVATSPDGQSWSVGAQPLIGADGENYFFPSVLRLSATDVRLFTAHNTSANNITSMAELYEARSGDGGMTF